MSSRKKGGMAMADKNEDGIFRNAVKGFNKSDVLEYIDAMKSRYMEDLNLSQKQIDDLQNSLTLQLSENNTIKSSIDQLKAEINQLTEENNRLKQTAQDKMRYGADLRRLAQEVEVLRVEKQEYMAKLDRLQESTAFNQQLECEVEQLRLQIKSNAANHQDDSGRMEEAKREVEKFRLENEKLSAQLIASQSRTVELEKQLLEMKEDNQHYNGLVGDAGAFILQMYSMGQRFLEIAFKRSDGCLDSLESSLTTLSSQTAEAREKVKNARQELLDYGALAGLKLDELMQTLESSAEIIAGMDE
jgi:DNA repair exonuclease SbcCD ATPase subunit